jgi:hypothetical protein
MNQSLGQGYVKNMKFEGSMDQIHSLLNQLLYLFKSSGHQKP